MASNLRAGPKQRGKDLAEIIEVEKGPQDTTTKGKGEGQGKGQDQGSKGIGHGGKGQEQTEQGQGQPECLPIINASWLAQFRAEMHLSERLLTIEGGHGQPEGDGQGQGSEGGHGQGDGQGQVQRTAYSVQCAVYSDGECTVYSVQYSEQGP